MATTINADNGAVSGSAGLKYSSDSSGVLALQTNGTTAVSISTAQVATFAQAPVLPAASIPQAALAAGVAGNGPAFFAYSANTTTLTAATDVKIILDTELFDTNSNYSTVNSRFTPTVAGYYQVNGVMTVNFWNSTILACYIFKNGASYCAGNTAYPQTVGGVRSVVSSLVYMNGTTDYIEMYGFNFNAITSNVVTANQAQTNFSASLVRSA
jgi:hypothetical protein